VLGLRRREDGDHVAVGFRSVAWSERTTRVDRETTSIDG
jgi:hypothetical protein